MIVKRVSALWKVSLGSSWPGLGDGVLGIIPQTDGGLVIGGSYNNVNITPLRGVVRLEPNGAPATDFQVATNASYVVQSLILQPDNKILAAGFAVPGLSYDAGSGLVLRLLSDGSLEPVFQPPSIQPGVRFLALDASGKNLIGGDFTNVNNTPINGIARLNPDGSLDKSFNVGAGVQAGQPWSNLDSSALGTFVSAIVVQPDGNILIGGQFTLVNGLPRTNIARLSGGPVLSVAGVHPDQNDIRFPISTTSGKTYTVEFKNAVSDAQWASLPAITGDNAVHWITDTNTIGGFRFYRLRIE